MVIPKLPMELLNFQTLTKIILFLIKMFSSVMFFTISLLLLVQCSWNLSTFLGLSTASSLYSNDSVVESALQMSRTYIETGKSVSSICVIVSIGLVVFSGIILFKKKK